MKAWAKALVAGLLAATPATATAQWDYGVHYPNGTAAVNHIYGPRGMFKPVTGINYPFNFYQQQEYNNSCTVAPVPVDRGALINAPGVTSAPDKDCHLLFDANDDKMIDLGANGLAFVEHNGFNGEGRKVQRTFEQMWFDDNWLARYMAIAYGRPQPAGLWAPNDYNRWAIVGGDTSNWSSNLNPWTGDYFDHRTYTGLYNFQTSGCSGWVPPAMVDWYGWISRSGATYDAANQRYDYPNVTEDYHYGFFLLFTQKMLASGLCNATHERNLLQHAVSLRSQILSRQVVNPQGELLGWVTERDNPVTLINTETIAANVLGLGAGGRYAFEAGKMPMRQGSGNYFLRPHNVLSAVKDLSNPGMLNFGPYLIFPTGTVSVDFYLRSPGASGNVANLDIYDANSGQVLASRVVTAQDFGGSSDWQRIRLNSQNVNPNNSLEFRVYWLGGSNLDIAQILVR
ncbi:hypothetical protein [Parerythrobacter jejuensis]|uniref:Uncharacterized protein n=1 Tax=Parerythrobacter jejuensis TaxID=795812 RepID=A0A845AW31_9SPHN|nr:hypothetical protein [Parerythrobacter jejuensis]MXP32716.1 hypothetical protein [Parerythrobacter jejuensis]